MRLKVPIENILGSAYYHYEITSTDYNPSIDNTVTISVTVKSVFGNPIKDKSVTLYQNGNSVGTATTNSNGIATFSYTFSDWDTHIFTCNTTTLDIKAKGWRTVKDDSYERVRYNEDTAQVVFHQEGLGYGTSWALQNANILGSAKDLIKPPQTIIQLQMSNSLVALAIRENGELWKKSYTGSSVTAGAYCVMEWKYR